MELEFGKKGVEGVDVEISDCKTALSRSGLESDYALNPYVGCSHGCRYCYSPSVIKEERPWGEFVEVKRNIPKILSKELVKKEKGVVRVGSVTDPYQKAEEEFRTTRKCLKQLNRKDFPVIVQTKSDLVTKDIDLFKEIDIDIGFTITSMDENFRKKFEPGAPSISSRLSSIKELKEEGIGVWVFIGPLFPYINDGKEHLKRMKKTLNSIGVSEIYLDKLNMRERTWSNIKDLLDENLREKYREIYFGDKDYFGDKRKLYECIGKTVF